jgi:DNA-binding transcriptional regulator YhcF (GntR family)
MFKINKKSKTPKYQQIVDITLDKIKNSILKKGDILPSLNSLSREYGVAKDTVVKAYDRLKEMNIVGSQHGKFFYIKNEYIDYDKKILVLSDVVQAPYRESLYKGIINNINDRIYLDFYFYNFNADLFKRLLEENLNDYDYFVVIPFPNTVVRETLKKVDQKKLLILDRAEELDNIEDYSKRDCSIIYQSHDYELEKALDEGIDLIKKYIKMILVFPEEIYAPLCIKDAFLRFTGKNNIQSEIVPSVEIEKVNKKEAYLIIEDEDLVNIIKASKKKNLEIGEDVGIISYNDKSLKEVIEDGITVVSIDWNEMGRKAAELINQPTRTQILEPTDLIIRNSL